MDAGGGVLSGQTMADTFNALRANDLIWCFFVNNYLMGKEPRPFDLLFWNADQTRMPKALHLYYLRKFYDENALARASWTAGEHWLDLSRFNSDLCAVLQGGPHRPCRSVYKGARLFGGQVSTSCWRVGPHRRGDQPAIRPKVPALDQPGVAASFEEWMAGAVEHPGSWWPHWAAWLAVCRETVPARDPTAGPLRPIEDTPGSFVKVRS